MEDAQAAEGHDRSRRSAHTRGVAQKGKKKNTHTRSVKATVAAASQPRSHHEKHPGNNICIALVTFRLAWLCFQHPMAPLLSLFSLGVGVGVLRMRVCFILLNSVPYPTRTDPALGPFLEAYRRPFLFMSAEARKPSNICMRFFGQFDFADTGAGVGSRRGGR